METAPSHALFIYRFSLYNGEINLLKIFKQPDGANGKRL